MKKIFTLLTLALVSIGTAWGNQTTLISGVTLPDIPSSTLDLSNQTDYTANAYGWIVETSPKANIGSKGWHSKLATDGGATNWTVPDGCTAPFVSSTDNSYSRYTVRKTERTHAIRFTGAEKASFLVSRYSDDQKTIVSLFSYVGTTQTLVETKTMASGSIGELLFESLTTTTTYIAYIYGGNSSNADWYEFALKAPANTYSVTYKAGEGTGDDVVDNNAAAVADCPNTFTAPAGKDFVNWNTESNGTGTPYAVGATVTGNLTLYAQWAASHSVTYSLGAATAGTVPTQAAVAEGATFEVAAVPGDLVAPSGKEFKCWNDGTTDYNPGATYTMGTSNVTLTAVYQDRTYQGLTPTTTLNFAVGTSSTFTTQWYTSRGYTTGYSYDALHGKAIFSTFAVYQSSTSQTWSKTDDGNSGNGSAWAASGDFKGGAYYSEGESSKWYWAVVRNTNRIFAYRVTGITSASALMGGKAIMEAYEVNAGVVTPDPVKETSIDAAGTISLTGLDNSKEYIIVVRGNNGNSNVAYYEIAFTFPAVPTVEATIDGTYEWATFVSPYALDFSSVSGLKAYIVTGHEGNAITKAQMTGTVPAGTPLLLNGATASIPVVASSTTDVSSNLLKIGAVAVESGKTKYVLSVEGGAAQFKKVTSAISASDMTGKAYLEFNEVIAAREFLSLDGDATAIKNIKVGTEDNVYYNLQGQRVLYPTKGLYIVNGKKVILK